MHIWKKTTAPKKLGTRSCLYHYLYHTLLIVSDIDLPVVHVTKMCTHLIKDLIDSKDQVLPGACSISVSSSPCLAV